MKTIIIYSKQVHACFASFSSSDVLLKQEFETGWSPEISIERQAIDGIPFPSGEELSAVSIGFDPKAEANLLWISFKADKTFYDVQNFMKCHNETPEFKALIKRYESNGWKTELSESTKAVQDRIYEHEEALSTAQRVEHGFVIPKWFGGLPVISYRGALSEELFMEPSLQRYLAGGGCHGYIGAHERTFATDERLEQLCKERGLSNPEIASFLTHSAGRHFADLLQGPDDVNEYLDRYLPPREELAELA